MFKLVVLFALIAVCIARPSLIASSPYYTYSTYHEPALATVGAVVKTIPTSASHASHSVVHNSDHVVQDVVAPVIRTTYASAPISYTSYASSPVSFSSYAATPGHLTYAATAPYTYSSSGSW